MLVPQQPIIVSTIELVSSDLAIDKADFPALVDGEEGWQQVKRIIAGKILGWMEYDVDHLKYVLYRLDINEHKVKTVLANASFEEAAMGIAELVLQREQEKAITRQQYSSGQGDWLDV